MKTNYKKWVIISCLPIICVLICRYIKIQSILENVEAMAQVVVEEPILTDDTGESLTGDPNICMKASEGERVYAKFCDLSSCVKKTAKKGKLVNKNNCIN